MRAPVSRPRPLFLLELRFVGRQSLVGDLGLRGELALGLADRGAALER